MKAQFRFVLYVEYALHLLSNALYCYCPNTVCSFRIKVSFYTHTHTHIHINDVIFKLLESMRCVDSDGLKFSPFPTSCWEENSG